VGLECKKLQTMNEIINVLSAISLAFLIIIGISFLIGGPLWLLWNWLMPTIFGLPYITFWQAVGVNLLSSILFKPAVNVKNNK
jgi:hypothetical protein